MDIIEKIWPLIIAENDRVVDIASDKSDPILKQLSPHSKPAFVDYIRNFRKGHKISITEFKKLSKCLLSLLDNRHSAKRKEQRILDWVGERVSQDDIVEIIKRFSLSPVWKFSIGHYILTGIMPKPFEYQSKWRIVCDYRGNRKDWKMFIEIYGDTDYLDILNPSSWDFVEQYKKMIFRSKTRHIYKTRIKPIFDKEARTLKIPIYSDTAQTEIKKVWPQVKQYQLQLVGYDTKYKRPMKCFVERLDMIKKLKRGKHYEYFYPGSQNFNDDKKVYNRLAQQKSRLIKAGYENPFRKVVTKRYSNNDPTQS